MLLYPIGQKQLFFSVYSLKTRHYKKKHDNIVRPFSKVSCAQQPEVISMNSIQFNSIQSKIGSSIYKGSTQTDRVGKWPGS